MTKSQISEIHNLPTNDKIRLVQDLWDDIAKENSLETISAEHKAILDERIDKLNSGTASFKRWSEVQAKYKK